jgi:hypothetical protein
MAQVIQTTKLNIGDVKAMARHAAALADARRRRNAAAAKIVTSIPREVFGMKSKLQTLLEAKAVEEFFETYSERERILSEWRKRNEDIIEELRKALKDYFKEAEALADLGSRPTIKAILSSAEVTE